MFKFYSITFTNKLGHEFEQIIIGTEEQANSYAIKEASANGCTYNVKYISSEKFDNIKNLTNY